MPPPAGYDYKAEILPETLEVVQQQYPQLMGMVEAGGQGQGPWACGLPRPPSIRALSADHRFMLPPL